MIFTPHNYQQQCINKVLNTNNLALFLQMGLGKSVISLTAFTLLQQDFAVQNCLIIAPKRVAESTWSSEAEKWEHTKHLRVSKVLGSEKQRLQALNTKADIYVINRENVQWLYSLIAKKNPFDMLIIDELSSFKNPSAKRFKALKKLSFHRIVGLTGTPTPNGLLDLWSQIYLIDKGERLGKTITSYRANFFTPGWGNGNIVYKYNLRPDAEKRIIELISDITLSMKAEDYLTLPERVNNTVYVDLDPALLKQYKIFEKEMVMGDITALNAASLAGKLVQFANGAIYNDERGWQHLHDAKLEALDEIIESLQGSPVLTAYNFKHDLSRLRERYKTAKVLDTDQDIRDWNAGKIPILLAHPASAGHGLNLQAGGSNIVWFGNTWSLELYQQFCARLHRQGQTKPTFIHHLVTRGTFDEKILAALERKDGVQESLMQALKDIKGK